MIYGYKYEPLIIRVPTWIDNRFQIQGYDQDNLYLQRAKEVRNRSYTLRIACLRYAEFLNGDGFRDPALAAMVINAKKRRTANNLLNAVCESTSWATGYYIHVGYNLNYKVNSLKVLCPEYNRFGLPDDDGDFFDLKYCTNWENDPYKNRNPQPEIFDYPVFNPDPKVVKEQIAAAGGILNYKGQIFHWVPEENQYPKAPFDTVFDQAQTQSSIAIFDLAMEQNGFRAATAIAVPGKFETPQEKQEMKDDINSFTGQGAGGTLLIENPDGVLKISDMITNLQMNNTDDLHTNVDKRVKNAIRECFGQPAEIQGIMPESGMFNKTQMQEAYYYYNTVTRRQRSSIAEELKKILEHWWQPVTSDFAIKEMEYATTTTTVAPGAPGAPPAGTPAPAGAAAAPVVNENLKNLTGKQAINFRRILRDYEKGKANRVVTTLHLSQGFALTGDEISELLDSLDASILEEKATPTAA